MAGHAPSRTRGQLETAINVPSKVLAQFGGVCIALLMLGTTVDVALRHFAGRGVPAIIAVVEIVLVVVIFSGLAHAEREKAHIRTTLVTHRLPPTLRARLHSGMWMVGTVFLGWVTYRTFVAAIDSYERNEASLLYQSIPLWPAKSVIAVGMVGLTLQAMLNVLIPERADSDDLLPSRVD